MALPEETKKKLYLWTLITLAVAGLLFVIFAVFINRATLIFQGNAPFNINGGTFNFSCLASPCQTTIAPGDYSLIITKDGYTTQQKPLSIGIFATNTQEITMQLIPLLRELGSEAELQFFARPAVTSESLGNTPLFYEEGFIAYLGRNPENGRQTLYYRSLQSAELGPETVATSFIRDLTDYTIVPAIASRQKIAVIDNSAQEGTLYMVDLATKERHSLLSFARIENMKWIPETNNFLLEARDFNQTARAIYYYEQNKDSQNQDTQNQQNPQSAAAASPRQLPLRTSLANIDFLDPQNIIAITSQAPITPAENQQNIFIALEDTEAAAQNVALETPPETETSIPLSFIRYSLQNSQTFLIATQTFPTLPTQAKINPPANTLLFLINNTVYELKFQ